jgi:hypothetical protein
VTATVPPTKPAIILDKNVLQRLSPAGYEALAAKYHLLMPDVLFFECLKADPVERARCFGALPPGDNPITLVHHIGEHLRHEMETGRPLGRPSAHPLTWHYRFNPRLQDTGSLPPEVEDTIESGRNEHLARVADYIERIRAMQARLTEVSREHGINRPKAAERIRAGLLDLPTVRDFLRAVRDPEGNEFSPPVDTLGPNSAIVVHFQVTYALALHRALDQPGEFESEVDVKRLTGVLARELFDADYLTLGVLEGGLATHEKRLRRIYAWLRPNALLYPPQSAPTGDSAARAYPSQAIE